MNAKINEIFSSIQGEGPIVGYKQLFIRFCGCNLNCKYCDTEFTKGIDYTPEKLQKDIMDKYDINTFHSISLTGGEPLASVEFLKAFLPLVYGKVKIYLETNATLYEQLSEIKSYINIISADIKLKSCSGLNSFNLHNKFFEQCTGITTFAKIVFDKNITEDEIEYCIDIGKKYNIELILQPKMIENTLSVSSEFCNEILEKFTKKYERVRLIPQVHKFLEIR